MRPLTTLIGALLILLAGAGLTNAQQADAPPAEALTLERAIRIALEGNRPVRNARLDVLNFDDRAAELRTKRLPSFKVSTLVSQPLTPFEIKFEKGAFGTFAETGPIPNEETTIKSPMKPTMLMP